MDESLFLPSCAIREVSSNMVVVCIHSLIVTLSQCLIIPCAGGKAFLHRKDVWLAASDTSGVGTLFRAFSVAIPLTRLWKPFFFDGTKMELFALSLRILLQNALSELRKVYPPMMLKVFVDES